MFRYGRLALALVFVVAVGAACFPPLATPPITNGISFVSTTTVNGWKYDYYRNSAYPCSVSGFHTFVIGTKVGSSNTTPRPLWAFMHGGGAGYFAPGGSPVPGNGQKVEESASSLQTHLTNNGLMAKVRDDAAGFRTLAVSYCNHDVYAGLDSPDPNNPNLAPNGQPRRTNGLAATKSAIVFAEGLYPTTKRFVHGGSAGSAGTFGVAWSLQQQGIAPAGLVADASVVNQEAFAASFAAGICVEDVDPTRVTAIAARVHPLLSNRDYQPDKLVTGGHLTVPIMHIWNNGDTNTCGNLPLACPLRNGTTVTLGVTDCIHQPLQAAIAAQGPTSRSLNLPVCVDNDAVPDCSAHVVTNKANLVNTNPATPADYLTAIINWVHARLAD